MLTLVARNLVRRPLRTFFTTAGVAIGTAAYIALVALAHGMRSQSQQVVDLLGTDITVTRAQTPVPWMSWIGPEELAALRTVPGVASVSGVVVATTRAGPRDLFLVFGADPRQPLAKNLRMIEGRALRPGTSEMVVGESAAKHLDVRPGDRLELAGAELDVVGIFETNRGVLDASAVLDLAKAQAVFGANERVNLAFVNVGGSRDMLSAMNEIRRRFPRLEATPSALFTSRFAYLDLITAYARAFAVVALVLAAVMIANTIGMNVNERRQEIALLRSIGWSHRRITLLVGSETAAMIAVGSLISIPLAAGAIRLLDSGDATWVVPAQVSVQFIAEGIAVAFIAGLVFSLLPIADALRRRPAEALRSL